MIDQESEQGKDPDNKSHDGKSADGKSTDSNSTDSKSPDGGEQWRDLTELYEKMSQMLHMQMERAGILSEEAFDRALKETRERAEKLKEDYGEDVSRVSDALRRDWLNTMKHLKGKARMNLDMDRVQAGVLGLISKLAESAGSQLEHFINHVNERLTYKTGEIAGAGKLECTECQQPLVFDKPRRVPPCPKCRNTHFKRKF